MSGQFYDNADRRVYQFLNVAVDTGTVLGRFIGPPGKVGRVRGMEFIIINATTVDVAVITCGVNGATLPAAMTIPIASADVGGAMTAAQIAAAGAPEVAGVNDVELTADTVIEVETDQGATAGDADLTITVDWF